MAKNIISWSNFEAIHSNPRDTFEQLTRILFKRRFWMQHLYWFQVLIIQVLRRTLFTVINWIDILLFNQNSFKMELIIVKFKNL